LERRSIPVQSPSAGLSTDGANFGAACWSAASFRLVRETSVVSKSAVGLTLLTRTSSSSLSYCNTIQEGPMVAVIGKALRNPGTIGGR
jgi:hypothetical protein